MALDSNVNNAHLSSKQHLVLHLHMDHESYIKPLVDIIEDGWLGLEVQQIQICHNQWVYEAGLQHLKWEEFVWGSPRFWNSTVATYPSTRPKHFDSFIWCSSSVSFVLKAREQISGRLWASCPGWSSATISGHFGLHVKAMKRAGIPLWGIIARPS